MNDGFRVLRARAGVLDLPETPIWTFEGAVPGPVLRVRQDDELKVRFLNELPEATAIHWHGIRTPNAMDGTPYLTQPSVEAGGSFDYRFKVPDAGTFWYHAPWTRSGHVQRTLHGAVIVEEKAPIEIDRDIVLLFDDRVPRTDDIAVQTSERLRLRLINAARAQVLRLRFDRHAVRVMAVDGQPAQPFFANESRVTLGPGNRIDLFLDATLDPGEAASIFADDFGTEKEIGRFVYEPSAKRRPSPLPDPSPLPSNPLPERIDMRNALRIDAPLNATEAGSQVWTMTGASLSQFGAPLFSVKRGRAVVMAFPNRTDAAHAVHLHGHHARLLDNLDDGWKPFWLDTVLIAARQTTRIAFVADNPGKWMIACQMIGGQETGLVAWFEVS